MQQRIGLFGLMLCALSSWSCSVPDATAPDGNANSNDGDASSRDLVLDGGLITLQSRGRIILPSDSAVRLDGLRVVNSLGEEAADSDGGFALTNGVAGPMLSLVVDAAGNTVLLAFTDAASADSIEITAHETATALIYIALGGFALPVEEYTNILALIRESDDASTVSALIEQRLQSAPDWLMEEDSELIDMLQSIADNTRATASGKVVMLKSAKEIRRAQEAPQAVMLIIDPSVDHSEISGLSVAQSTDNIGINLTNHYRRHARYFVYKTGFVDMNDVEQTLDPPEIVSHKDGTDTQNRLLEAVSAIEGVARTVFTYFQGDQACVPKASKVISLSLPEGQKKGFFEVIVAGATTELDELVLQNGPPWFEAHSESLQSEWAGASSFATLHTVGAEAVLPAFFSVVGPLKSAAKNIEPGLIKAFMETVILEVPEASIKISRGEWSALATSVFKAFFTNGTVRLVALDLFENAYGERFKGTTLFENLQFAAGVLAIFDIGLTGIDVLKVVSHVNASNPYERFEITVIPPRVRIEPAKTDVVPGEFVDLVAYSTAEGTKQYRWSTPGINGLLDDGNGEMVTELLTQSNTVRYVSLESGTFGSMDTVSVVVEVPQADGGEVVRVGEASAELTEGFVVKLVPEVTTANSGETVTLTAETNHPGNTTFFWSTSGTIGQLQDSSGQSSRRFIETTDSTVSYLVDGDVNSLFVDAIGVTVVEDNVVLGEATGQVSVEVDNQVFINGSWASTVRDSKPAGIRSCVTAWIFVPKVQDAISYNVRGYGHAFNDGAEILHTWTRAGGDVVDMGGNWAVLLTQGCHRNESNPISLARQQARYSGMIVDVTVTLEP